MKLEKGKKYLITTDDWFFAPDGMNYKAVWGTVHGVKNTEDVLGIKTNARSTNWYVTIGNMVVAGCQIHYLIKSEKCNFSDVEHEAWDASNGIKQFKRSCHIYNADE